jgi:hypothetical protein
MSNTNTNTEVATVKAGDKTSRVRISVEDSYKLIDLASASNDQLYSARRHAWIEVFSSLEPKNQFGQRYSSGWQSYSEIQEYKQKLIDSRGIPEVEQELISRGLDPKSKNYTRLGTSISIL